MAKDTRISAKDYIKSLGIAKHGMRGSIEVFVFPYPSGRVITMPVQQLDKHMIIVPKED